MTRMELLQDLREEIFRLNESVSTGAGELTQHGASIQEASAGLASAIKGAGNDLVGGLIAAGALFLTGIVTQVALQRLLEEVREMNQTQAMLASLQDLQKRYRVLTYDLAV